MSAQWIMRENYLGEILVDSWLRPWHRVYVSAVGAWIAVIPDHGMWYQRSLSDGGWGEWRPAPPGLCLEDVQAFVEALERLDGRQRT